MALNAAQRQAKRRQKLKDTNSYDECKRKTAQQKRLSRTEKRKKEAELSASGQNKLQVRRRKETRERVARC